MKVICKKEGTSFTLGGVYSAEFYTSVLSPEHKVKIFVASKYPSPGIVVTPDYFVTHFCILELDPMPKSELELRKDQIKKALIEAFDKVASEDWFKVLSSIQEAEIIVRACRDDQTNRGNHNET